MTRPPQVELDDLHEEIVENETQSPDSEDADRTAWLKDEDRAFHKVKLGVIYGIPAAAAAAIVVYLIHALGPECVRWLSPEDLKDLRSAAISIVAGVSTSLSVQYFYRK